MPVHSLDPSLPDRTSGHRSAEVSLRLKLFLSNLSTVSFLEAPSAACGRDSAVSCCLQCLLKAGPRQGQWLEGPEQMKLGGQGPKVYSRWGMGEDGMAAVRHMWVTQRCVLGKAGPKAASKLGSVMFALIPLAKTWHGQVQGSVAGAPPVHGHRKKCEQIQNVL